MRPRQLLVFGSGGYVSPWPCTNASCRIVNGLPFLEQPFEIRAAAPI